MSLRGNVHVYLGCTKTRSPEFGTVLHWRPPDVHILDTDPSLYTTQNVLPTIAINILKPTINHVYHWHSLRLYGL